MENVNQSICDGILRYGTIKSDKTNTFSDGEYRTYIINYSDIEYVLTKHNGIWVYIHRNFG